MKTVEEKEIIQIQNINSEVSQNDILKDELAIIQVNDEDTEMVGTVTQEQVFLNVLIEQKEGSKSPQPQNELNEDESLETQREKALALIEDSGCILLEEDEQMLEAPLPAEEAPQTVEVDWDALKYREADNFKDFQLTELAIANWKNDTDSQRYLKGCHFSPDGTCLLASTNLVGMTVFELPLDLYNKDLIDSNRPITSMKPVIHVPTVGNMYDLAWYPFMNSSYPETCFWISTCQNEPIKMFDAFNGSHKGSFRGYDNADELEAALSVTFSADGQKIFAGYKKSIKIFDTNIPGRDYKVFNLKTSVSCIATNYYQESLLAVGSWNKSIKLLDVRNLKANPSDEMILHKGGVTYLKFSRDGSLLVSGARKDNNMFCWDLRMLDEPLHTLERRVENNQRIFFDTSPGTSSIISGDSRGILHVWNIDDLNERSKPTELQFPLYNDCLNGVSFHPFFSMIATSSGQYHFDDEHLDEEELALPVENILNIWWTGKSVEMEENPF